jgi:hypothetical protein
MRDSTLVLCHTCGPFIVGDLAAQSLEAGSRSVTGAGRRPVRDIRRSARPAGRPGWSSRARGNECSVASRQLGVRAQVRWPASAGEEPGRSVELVLDHPGGAAAEMAESLPGRGREHHLGRFAQRDQHGQPPQRYLGVGSSRSCCSRRAPAGGRSSSRRGLQRSSSACRRRPAEAGCRASRAGCHRARRAPRPRPLTARTRPWRAVPRRRR